MAVPTDAALYGIAIRQAIWDDVASQFMIDNVSLGQFFMLPVSGEKNPFPRTILFPPEPYDDGGGATVAHARFGACPFS